MMDFLCKMPIGALSYEFLVDSRFLPYEIALPELKSLALQNLSLQLFSLRLLLQNDWIKLDLKGGIHILFHPSISFP